MKKSGSYLLLEAALFMVVITVVTAVGGLDFGSAILNSKEELAQNEVNQIGSAVIHYHYDTGKYPSDLNVLVKAGSGDFKDVGPWAAEIKKDPWGNAYRIVSDKNGFVVYSTVNGKAKQFSTDKVDKDVIGFHGM